MPPAIDVIKITAVGDAAVGKTSLLITYSSGTFPQEYVPTVFDNYSTNVMVRGDPVQLNLWDTAGNEESDRLRPLAYPHTNLFLCVFSLVDPSSLDSIKKVFIPEFRQYCPEARYLLVGTKLDLRNDSEMIRRLRKRGQKPISKEAGSRAARDFGADGYQECSSLTSKGVKQVFDKSVEVVIHAKEQEKLKMEAAGGCCVIL